MKRQNHSLNSQYLPSFKRAFSLIELSIVLVVIGVLIVGIIGGSAMIRSATINGARSFTAKSVVPTISGLVAWYETSLNSSLQKTEAYDGSQISTWYDISPNSAISQKNTLTTTASANVLYLDDGINSVPSINFSGSGNLTLSSFYQGSLAQSTIFLVIQPVMFLSTNTTPTLLDSYSSGSTSSIAISATTAGLNAGSSVTSSTTFTMGNNYIVTAYFNGSSSKIHVNDASTSLGTISPGTNSLTGLTLGSDKSGGTGFSGLVSEVIIYNRPLQIQERRDVSKYLSYKYKISVTGI